MATSTSTIASVISRRPLLLPAHLSTKSRYRKLSFNRLHQSPTISCDFSCFEVRDVSYRPPGTQLNILNEVSFSLPEKSFGLIFGQSGSGKTTLLQLLAGLSEPTSGSICIQRYRNDGNPYQSSEPLSPERVGIVFQFPERYFVADTIIDEVIFGWPRKKGSLQLKEYLALNLQKAVTWVGLNGIPFDKDPQSLSGGYKRRLALAIQLVQVPDLLILDEPLAGLDWKARADVVKLLKQLKKELTLLVVSHDLKILGPSSNRCPVSIRNYNITGATCFIPISFFSLSI
ncbi:ABC transporter I family member 11, chloroplastic isoform X2 [Jatropha curcas]|uniref:ABC transporter I family member 11, chloroplastic isoform X2 n=1 Tax=Jatropha curcas TaxID=180498 RepID=UPI0018930F3D|nr:ABC transporter I family member 11, chloroplastic isoform X2 [Jatropha curcas]